MRGMEYSWLDRTVTIPGQRERHIGTVTTSLSEAITRWMADNPGVSYIEPSTSVSPILNWEIPFEPFEISYDPYKAYGNGTIGEFKKVIIISQSEDSMDNEENDTALDNFLNGFKICP